MLDLTPDELLTTTRSVRRRLDFERKVERELIEECLEIAFQAPNGSNLNTWQWVVVDDPSLVAQAAVIYNAGLDDYVESLMSVSCGLVGKFQRALTGGTGLGLTNTAVSARHLQGGAQ